MHVCIVGHRPHRAVRNKQMTEQATEVAQEPPESAEPDKLLLTPAEAESLLADGEYIHNYMGGGMMMIGCDYSREEAIAAFAAAKSIEIGGPSCKSFRHPLAVFDANDRLSFFEADMAKVEAFEAARGQ